MISHRWLTFVLFATSALAAHSAACTVKTTGTGTPSGSDAGAGSDKSPPATDESTAADPGTSSAAPLTCAQAIACLDPCGEKDVKCAQTCRDRSSPAAVTQVESLASCVNASGCADDDACIEQACATELDVCFGG
jgi:hypothetical protein